MVPSAIPYMRWAKEHALEGELPLTGSAVPPVDWADICCDPGQLQLYRYSSYGEPETLRALADSWGLQEGEVLIGASVTHVHFCIAASALAPGDAVLVETPGYTPLTDALSCLRVRPVLIPRRFEEAYRFQPAELRRAIEESGARLMLATHLHNPSGVAMHEEDIETLVTLCDEYGLEVLCDEMYRPFLDPDPGPLHLRHPNITSIMGLNKVHGLPQIRFGWAFASTARVELARRILDATTVHNSCLTDQVALHAVPLMAALAARAREISRAGWQILGPWLTDSPLDCVPPDGGLICFPRIPRTYPSGEEFRRDLLEVGVGVTPGSYFGSPQHVRIGFGVGADRLREGLRRVDVQLG